MNYNWINLSVFTVQHISSLVRTNSSIYWVVSGHRLAVAPLSMEFGWYEATFSYSALILESTNFSIGESLFLIDVYPLRGNSLCMVRRKLFLSPVAVSYIDFQKGKSAPLATVNTTTLPVFDKRGWGGLLYLQWSFIYPSIHATVQDPHRLRERTLCKVRRISSKPR